MNLGGRSDTYAGLAAVNEQEKQKKIAEIKAAEELKRKEQEDLDRVMEENKRKLEEAQKKAQEELVRSNQERFKVSWRI